ncbi:MAG: NAD-dependent epimerase/dehydratase family protein, partial [Chloroflexi bacterium]|nr:NAD-dependent epimerase/dehydratase family protein [Chloroflexota bacterium]
MRVLVTGGAGFIGSHVCRTLLAEGHDVTVLDNLSRGRRDLIPEGVAFVEADLADEAATERALRGHDAVIHLASFLEVAVSVAKPVLFAENNIVNSVRLLEAMRRADVGKIVFSSSATVYGVPKSLPLRERPAGHAGEPLRRDEGGGRDVPRRLSHALRLRLHDHALLQPLRPERAVRPGVARRPERRARDVGEAPDPP